MMKKDSAAVTAANSKTMNAVEKVTLYAASKKVENIPGFISVSKEGTDGPKKKSKKHK
ncbi:MAG: hypothetical protein ABIN67_15240 [Ferruginibacter sp.]